MILFLQDTFPSYRDPAAATLNLCLPNIKNICIDFLTMGTGNKHQS